jgi:hypothetical protein
MGPGWSDIARDDWASMIPSAEDVPTALLEHWPFLRKISAAARGSESGPRASHMPSNIELKAFARNFERQLSIAAVLADGETARSRRDTF